MPISTNTTKLFLLLLLPPRCLTSEHTEHSTTTTLHQLLLLLLLTVACIYIYISLCPPSFCFGAHDVCTCACPFDGWIYGSTDRWIEQMEHGVVVTKYDKKGAASQRVLFLEVSSMSVAWRDLDARSSPPSGRGGSPSGHHRSVSFTSLLKGKKEALPLAQLIEVYIKKNSIPPPRPAILPPRFYLTGSHIPTTFFEMQLLPVCAWR